MLCEGASKVMNATQEGFDVFVALSGYSVEGIIEDNNLVDALN
jgi:hypothetical protein